MAEKERKIIRDSNLQEYFYEKLLHLNGKSLYKVCGEAIYYSSKVLNDFSQSGKYFEITEGKVREKILGKKLLEAGLLQKDEQKKIFKDVGDTALLLCGYFSPSINKKILNVDYYHTLGKSAYLRLNDIVPNYFGMDSFYKVISDSFGILTVLISHISNEHLGDLQLNQNQLFENLAPSGEEETGQKKKH